MSSPLIVNFFAVEDGVLKGKAAVAEYWKPGISQQPPLRFELMDVLVGINQLTIYYRGMGRKVVAETLTFDNGLKVIAGAPSGLFMSDSRNSYFPKPDNVLAIHWARIIHEDLDS